MASSILRHDLEVAEAWLIKCKVHEALGNWRRAAYLYTKLSVSSQDGQYYEIAAQLFLRVDLLSDAMFCLREAISLYELQGLADSACRLRERLQALETRFNES